MIGSQRLACCANWRKVGAGWVEGDNRSGLGEVPNQDLLEPFEPARAEPVGERLAGIRGCADSKRGVRKCGSSAVPVGGLIVNV